MAEPRQERGQGMAGGASSDVAIDVSSRMPHTLPQPPRAQHAPRGSGEVASDEGRVTRPTANKRPAGGRPAGRHGERWFRSDRSSQWGNWRRSFESSAFCGFFSFSVLHPRNVLFVVRVKASDRFVDRELMIILSDEFPHSIAKRFTRIGRLVGCTAIGGVP